MAAAIPAETANAVERFIAVLLSKGPVRPAGARRGVSYFYDRKNSVSTSGLFSDFSTSLFH
jgi:hypothetical protein